MKHLNGEYCPKCETMFADGHPDLHYWFQRIKEYFPDAHASCVYRGKADQDKMVKEGLSLLKWPTSRHNVLGPDQKPRSEAMDLFRLDVSGSEVKADFRMGFYVQIANWLEDQSAPVEWGGHFRHLVDGPHFQLKAKA